ncbi:hypothetical protein [Rhodovastum atsumiense]|uniref:hypothetical protein n=1 Tax=Rhodovastum atsumiense TaxID=504468 RepID=UPI00139F2A4C|nr:hypothetical protein [Rhodovastum atsumiense]
MYSTLVVVVALMVTGGLVAWLFDRGIRGLFARRRAAGPGQKARREPVVPIRPH